MKKNMKKIIILVVSVVLVMILLTGCNGRDYEQIMPEKLPVKTAEVFNGDIAEKITVLGNIYAQNKINVSTKLMAKITEFPFEKGTAIDKGTMVLKIDDKEIQAKIIQAESMIDEGKANLLKVQANIIELTAEKNNILKNYERIKTLYEKGSVDAKMYDDTRTAYEVINSKVEGAVAQKKIVEAGIKNAQALLEETRSLLEYTFFKAPFDGFITEKYSDEGNITNPGMPILSFENLNRVKIEFLVSEKDITKIKHGNKVDLFINNEHIKTSLIDYIVPSGNINQRAFVVGSHVENADLFLKPGMFVKGDIYINKKENTLLVSKESLIENRGKYSVFKIKNEKANLINVEVGIMDNNFVEIISGLNAEDVVVTEGKQNLSEGSSVRVSDKK
ncbi:MAG: efflux RND transporter periplasmic adaptor subunit [Candidatus Muiribacteriota bacterium]